MYPSRARTFARYTAALVGLTYVLIVLGGVVRTTGAGDACPDWPLCHGRLIPPPEPRVLLEYAHRLVASMVGLLGVGAVVWTHRLSELRGLRPLAWAALGLVVVQGLVGGVVVLSGLEDWTVVVHLGLALLVLAVLLMLAFRASGIAVQSGGLRPYVLLVLGTLYLLILLGGYVGASAAGLACPDWPLCRGRLLPPPLPGVHVHFTHRVLALGGLVLLAGLVVRTRSLSPVVRRAAHLAAALYGLQILVGALNKWFLLHPAVVSAHLALAALIWGAVVTVFCLEGVRT
ncbi:MAG: COX15/CtaA family protein [Armatimonadetes bacterium]|nr:COX15/CtaA family protein [Armatimonadota bacterium]MDW8154543.1 COX15/CtaA family protein [Armatimonadota bacterium]